MGQWAKTLLDGSSLVGTDLAVEAGIASWSKTPTYILGASLEHHGYTMELVGLGNYWQSDTFEATYPGPNSAMVQRRIERLIEPTDQYFYLFERPKYIQLTFNQKVAGAKWVTIPRAWLGQWLILEYDIKSKIHRYYIRSNRF